MTRRTTRQVAAAFSSIISVVGAGPMCKARDAESKAATVAAAAAPAVLPLWPAGAPGSESRRQLPEALANNNNNNITGIHNPSLTLFPAEPGPPTGAAVVVIPGGGHRAAARPSLGMDRSLRRLDRRTNRLTAGSRAARHRCALK